jgi:hypothetical protein
MTQPGRPAPTSAALDYDNTIIGALEMSDKKWVLAVQLPGVKRHTRHGKSSPPEHIGQQTRPLSLKPGTRLVREWGGATYMVLIHAGGIEWRGQRYRSLSLVARKITGARWSGPRFFGLRQRPLDSTSTARTGHGHVL